jgi:hypothetical protein
VQKWRRSEEGTVVTAYIPQSFAPGEAFQFDWSHELVELGGIVSKVKVAPSGSVTAGCSSAWPISGRALRWCLMPM